MNAGKWIIIAYVLFAAFIGILVTVCMRQDISLVSADYYKNELAYQDQIERIKRTEALQIKPDIHVHSYLIQITFDSTCIIERGTVALFCPSNTKMDRAFALETGKNEFTQDVSFLLPGMYRLRLNWTMEGKDYYTEEIINL